MAILGKQILNTPVETYFDRLDFGFDSPKPSNLNKKLGGIKNKLTIVTSKVQ